MREIINIHCGQAGNFIGSHFWETVGSEHEINLDGTPTTESVIDSRDVLYDETKGGRWIPRTLFVDMDPSSNEAIQSSELGRLFPPDSFISGKFSSGANWARAFYGVGSVLIDPFMDKIRRIMEACESPQGFQLTHAIDGGTGGGLTSKIMGEFCDMYPYCINSSHSVIPWSKEYQPRVPYNSTLTMQHLLENCQMTTLYDNFSLERILFLKSKKLSFTFKDINSLIALAMSGQTAGMRFPGELNTSLRHLAINLIPFPRIHFFIPSVTPILFDEKSPLDAEEIIRTMTQPDSIMVNTDPLQGRFFTATAIFRGAFKTAEVEYGLKSLVNKYSKNYMEWIPENFKSCVCKISPTGYSHSTFFLGNTTALYETLKGLAENLKDQHRMKASIHYFLDEGMDEMEFVDAETNVNDLISEYCPCCYCGSDVEEEIEQISHLKIIIKSFNYIQQQIC